MNRKEIKAKNSSCFQFSATYLSIVTILACVTRKMLGKEMLDHLDDVEQYYR